jgi:hypothetical protein
MTNAATESTAKPGLGDLAEIFYAPSAVFERRREGSFGLPLLVLVVLATLFSFLTSSLTQAAMHADAMRGMQPAIAAGKMTVEQANVSAGFFEKFGPFVAGLVFLLSPFIVGLVSWIFAKIVGMKQELGVAAMIATFSMFPRLAGMLVGAIIAAMTPEAELTSATKLTLSPAHFIDITTHPAVAQLTTRLDLFTIWAYALLGIGMYVTARSTKGQAWATAIGTWVIMSLPAVWGALRAG